MEIKINTVVELENAFLLNDSLYVPKTPGNRHYQMITEWIAEGNLPTPEPPKITPVVIDEVAELKTRILSLEGKMNTVETKVSSLESVKVNPISAQ